MPTIPPQGVEPGAVGRILLEPIYTFGVVRWYTPLVETVNIRALLKVGSANDMKGIRTISDNILSAGIILYNHDEQQLSASASEVSSRINVVWDLDET